MFVNFTADKMFIDRIMSFKVSQSLWSRFGLYIRTQILKVSAQSTVLLLLSQTVSVIHDLGQPNTRPD